MQSPRVQNVERQQRMINSTSQDRPAAAAPRRAAPIDARNDKLFSLLLFAVITTTRPRSIFKSFATLFNPKNILRLKIHRE